MNSIMAVEGQKKTFYEMCITEAEYKRIKSTNTHTHTHIR